MDTNKIDSDINNNNINNNINNNNIINNNNKNNPNSNHINNNDANSISEHCCVNDGDHNINDNNKNKNNNNNNINNNNDSINNVSNNNNKSHSTPDNINDSVTNSYIPTDDRDSNNVTNNNIINNNNNNNNNKYSINNHNNIINANNKGSKTCKDNKTCNIKDYKTCKDNHNSKDSKICKDNKTYNNISPDYLAQLLSDRKKLQTFSGLFIHLDKLLDNEIIKIRANLFHLPVPTSTDSEEKLPEPIGETVSVSEKVLIPVHKYPDYNFVGRLLGPRGRTAKQFETDMECKIMIRGRGSLRDVAKDIKKLKTNQEFMNEDLHVLVTVEDTENRVHIKLRRAVEAIERFFIPAPEGEDCLKKKQLMELAIINGTYRETKSSSSPPSSLSSPSSLLSSSSSSSSSSQFLLSSLPTQGLATQFITDGPTKCVMPTTHFLLQQHQQQQHQQQQHQLVLTSPQSRMMTSTTTSTFNNNATTNQLIINSNPQFATNLTNIQDLILPQSYSNQLVIQLDPSQLVHAPSFVDLSSAFISATDNNLQFGAGPIRRQRIMRRDEPYTNYAYSK